MGLFQSTRLMFTGRRGRDLRESLTAYLFIFPAVLLIFVFGIFPVFFALYVSLHQWRLVQGDFIGLENYFAAVDNLAYVGLFTLAIVALVWAGVTLRNAYRQLRDRKEPLGWIAALPAAVQAASVLAFFRWGFFQIPEVLNIARQLRGVDRTRELFIGLLSDAFHSANVYPHWQLFTRLLIAGAVLGILAMILWRNPDNAAYQLRLSLVWLGLTIGVGLLYITFQAIAAAYTAALETGVDPGIWPQVLSIFAGAILLWLSWRVWRSADRQPTGSGFVFRLLGGVLLIVAGVLLIAEIPAVIAAGDADLWEGLKVTVFFSAGTVPVQLAIALFLAVLLFQKLKGSALFRIIFFIPYVTPAVASAAVFKQLFSNRASAPANAFVTALGFEPQLWLREPEGIFRILADLAQIQIPDWAAGPSMALAVIILQSVWTYVGYNTVIYLAGLGNIPMELTEAAEIDGANKWSVFRHITFPLLSPTTYFLSLLGVMGTFKAFATIWVMRDGAALGTTDPFSVVIFIEFFTKTRYGYASALSFVLFAVILSLTLINNRVQGSRVFYG